MPVPKRTFVKMFIWQGKVGFTAMYLIKRLKTGSGTCTETWKSVGLVPPVLYAIKLRLEVSGMLAEYNLQIP